MASFASRDVGTHESQRKENKAGSTVASKSARSATKRKSAPEHTELMRCKRRANFQNLGYSLPQANPASVARRNERERNRVKQVNVGFAKLRSHVPDGEKNKKLSKVETLKQAIDYIQQLHVLLEQHDMTMQQQQQQQQQTMTTAAYPPPPAYSNHSLEMVTYSPESVFVNTCSPQTYPPTMSYLNSSQTCSSSLSIGSPSPSYLSDASSGDAPLSPEEEDLLEFAHWF